MIFNNILQTIGAVLQDSQQIAETIRERLSMIREEQTKLTDALGMLTVGRTMPSDTPPRRRGRPKGSKNGTRSRTKAAA